MKKTKQRAVNLGYGYVLDEELTLKKSCSLKRQARRVK